MARVNGNIATEKVSGAIGKQLVYRQFNGKTVVSKYPNRSEVQYTPEQLEFRKLFAKASKFASDIVKDPVKKKAYKAKRGASIYHTALRDFMIANAKEKAAKK
jgi:hypothetical protein